ncbi:NAD(P)-binding protein [Dendrothele bispora CBS 962.96]|uniref:NAD(P)-binding protein n=1 Tax=Dendrothele bispora (strain CBS 962.96) TaxID=1314807 RepID=A0A4S8MK81_DENBC|nr:NAD(P)-binding protein [Dendrothele bispora CBS 962.96]
MHLLCSENTELGRTYNKTRVFTFPFMPTLRVRVTGGTGYLGSHIIAQLLASQQIKYLVRTTVKPGDKSLLQEIFPDAGDRLEAVETKSLTCDYLRLGYMKDVDAVIHAALPDGAKFVEGVVNGTTGILEAAIKVGVKKVIITSTFVTLCELDTYKETFSSDTLGPGSWCSSPSVKFDSVADINRAIRSGKVSGFAVYQMSKTLAEKKVWDIVRRVESEGKHVDVTTILPPVMFGPYATPTYPLPSCSEDLNANQFIYQLISHSRSSSPSISPSYPDLKLGYMVDVRDAAQAHILAFSSLSGAPASSNAGQSCVEEHDTKQFDERIILCSHTFTWPQLAEMIAEKRPDLKERLPPPGATTHSQNYAPLDLDLMKSLFSLEPFTDNITAEDGSQAKGDSSSLSMTPWEETVLASLDLVLRWEEAYESAQDSESSHTQEEEGEYGFAHEETKNMEDVSHKFDNDHRVGERRGLKRCTSTREQPEDQEKRKLRKD